MCLLVLQEVLVRASRQTCCGGFTDMCITTEKQGGSDQTPSPCEHAVLTNNFITAHDSHHRSNSHNNNSSNMNGINDGNNRGSHIEKTEWLQGATR